LDALPKIKLLSKEEYFKMLSILDNNGLNIYYYVDWWDLEVEGYFDNKEEQFLYSFTIARRS